ncbi:serine carboxypeptidase-like 20 isoform X2 [Benincasa hispida]|uniref:serine carboxypeptidase-like 20 isoform X2 n=1 Tax=Benincasa hispida TaxID=102211 RepID=UPI00190057F4|nr:serine carboxypeptidase-like 20 isoform X2 [Benincasa hispida]
MGKGLLMLLVWKCVLVVAIEAAPEGSIVTHLPGFTSVFPSKHYSGYIKIDQIESGKRLFYYFVTSERSPAEDPVVLWLNGGPGCSSFDAFVYEHGPFNFEEGKPKGTLPTLHLNPYSWSKVSNIIYLDSPAGVGLSYSSNKDNYITGDIQTASDTHNFLLKWFKEFPEFLKNPFYIAGESFAGIYVPTLASQLVKGLKSGVVPVINLKGYMVGNGVTDQKFDGNALVPFAYGMALISDAIFKEAEASCGGNYYSPQTSECFDKLDRVDQNDEVATTWLNDESVRMAIHAEPQSVIGPWELCTHRISYSHNAGSMIPYHRNLTSQGYKALIFSGDHDMCVPYTGSQAWTSSLGYKIVDEWRPWFSNSQVSGYLQGYEHNLTFITIKGAGHTVPEYKPREALDFYSRWLEGNPI